MDAYEKIYRVMRMTNAAKAGAVNGMLFAQMAMKELENKNLKLAEFCTEVSLLYTEQSSKTALRAKALSDEICEELGVEE